MHIVRSLKICRRMLFLETYPQIYDLVEGPMREFPSFSWQGTYRWRPIPKSMIWWKVPCNVRWRSLLRLRLRCPVLQANRLWLFGRTGDFPQLQLARNLPLETYPQIYDLVEGPMQRSLALTPPPAATLSCSPSESPLALRENRRFSPASAGLENATAGSGASRSTEGALSQ